MPWTWAYAAAAAAVLIAGTIWWQAQDSASTNQSDQLVQDNRPTNADSETKPETNIPQQPTLPNETQIADAGNAAIKPALESNISASNSAATDATTTESKPDMSNVATSDAPTPDVPTQPNSGCSKDNGADKALSISRWKRCNH